MGNEECIYLNGENKKQSQKLYEDVFSEDRKEFVDYYYENIGKRNKILAVKAAGKGEDEREICGMLHQNPHNIWIGQAEVKTEYIYAVAVGEAHRHKGYMRQMLGMALQNIFTENICFTYLFPVRRGLYEPFGFGYVDSLKTTECEKSDTIKRKNEGGKLISDMDEEMDWMETERFIRLDCQKRQGIYLAQTEAYLKEWLELARKNGEQSNIFIYKKQREISQKEISQKTVKEKAMRAVLKIIDGEITEAMGDAEDVKEAWVLWKSQFARSQTERVGGDIEDKTVDMLPAMVRILHLETFISYLLFPGWVNVSFFIEDELFPENQGVYRVREGKGKKVGGSCDRRMHIREFTEWLFTLIPFRIQDQI